MLLAVLPKVSRPVVKEAVVRSLSTPHAPPIAAEALLDEFRNTSDAHHPSLKWALGNALATVTTPAHADALFELALDRAHGAGRQMLVDRIARFSKEDRVVPTLIALLDDDDLTLPAMGGLRRRLGPADPPLDRRDQPVPTSISCAEQSCASFPGGRTGSPFDTLGSLARA